MLFRSILKMNCFADNKVNKRNGICIIVFVGFCFFVGLLMINSVVPLIADDYCRGATAQHLGFLAILKAVYKEYFSWAGRIVPTFFTYLFLQHGIFFIGVINSLMLLFLSYVIFLHAYLRQPNKISDGLVLILIFGLIWFFPTAGGETFFWKTGAIQYLWPMPLTLCFIYYYRLLLSGNDNFPDELYIRVAFFASGLLLGTWLENLSVTISAFLVATLLYIKFLQKKNIKTWACLGCLGYVIGTTILIIAPGNFVRLHSGAGVYNYNLLEKFIPIAKMIFYHYKHQVEMFPKLLSYYAPILLSLPSYLSCMITMVFVVPIVFALSSVFRFKNFKTCFVFLGLALLSAFAMLGHPGLSFSGRTAFVSDIFIVIVIVSLVSIDKRNLVLKIILGGVCGIIFYCLVVDMFYTYEAYRVHYYQDRWRQLWINKSLLKGNKDVVLRSIYSAPNGRSSGRYFFFNDITNDVNGFWNVAYSRYYGLNTVKLISNKDIVQHDFIKNCVVTKNLPFAVTVYDNKVYYMNTEHGCSSIGNKNQFFLHVYPKSRSSLSSVYGLDFSYDVNNQALVLSDDFKNTINNVCVFVAFLPFYPIDHIKAGQYKDNIIYWEININVDNMGQGNFDGSKFSDWLNGLR